MLLATVPRVISFSIDRVALGLKNLQVSNAFLEASSIRKIIAQQEFTACAQLKVSSDTGHLETLGDDGVFF